MAQGCWLLRGRFKNTPVGILVPDREKLYVKDTWFENISNSAMVINNFVPPDLQVNLENIKLSNVPYSVRFNGRTQGWSKNEVKMDYEAPAPVYSSEKFLHGLHIEVPHGSEGAVDFTTKMDQTPIRSTRRIHTRRHACIATSVNLGEYFRLGAKGDGSTDCTDIFEKAIAKYNTIYIPMGKYVISRTLTLRRSNNIDWLSSFNDPVDSKRWNPWFYRCRTIAKPLLVTPKEGSNGITGIGFNFGNNPGVIGIKWMAGIHSYINDGLFNGGGGDVFLGKDKRIQSGLLMEEAEYLKTSG